MRSLFSRRFRDPLLILVLGPPITTMSSPTIETSAEAPTTGLVPEIGKTTTQVRFDLAISKEDVIDKIVDTHYKAIKAQVRNYRKTVLKPYIDELVQKTKLLQIKLDDFVATYQLDLVQVVKNLYPKDELAVVLACKLIRTTDVLYVQGPLTWCNLNYSPFIKGDIHRALRRDSEDIEWLIQLNFERVKYWKGHAVLELRIDEVPEFRSIQQEFSNLLDESDRFFNTKAHRQFTTLSNAIDAYGEVESDSRYRSEGQKYWINVRNQVKSEIVDSLMAKALNQSLEEVNIKAVKVPTLSALPATIDDDDDEGLFEDPSENEG